MEHGASLLQSFSANIRTNAGIFISLGIVNIIGTTFIGFIVWITSRSARVCWYGCVGEASSDRTAHSLDL
jgi:hypothetical protein